MCRNEPRIHPEQAFDDAFESGLLREFAGHRIEGILAVLDPAARQCPVGFAAGRYMSNKQYPILFEADPVCRDSRSHR